MLALCYPALNQKPNWKQQQIEWGCLGEAVLTSMPGFLTLTEEML